MDISEHSKTNLKEQRDHGSFSFPCDLYETYDNPCWPGAKHHWHDEMEILYFMEGQFELIVNMETYSIDRECFYFINPGELHSIIVHSLCKESAVLFHPRILSFDYYDTAQSRILQPMLKGELYFPRCVFPEHPVFRSLKKEYLEIVNVFYQKGFSRPNEDQTIIEDLASQLFIRADLLKILGHLERFSLLSSEEHTDDYRVNIIKNALAFIHEHYQEKFYIGDLAKQANMNEQYFCRFFKKIIGKTPVTYINEYRISRAITMLQDTQLPVMNICLDCGFNNLGNFLKEFRKKTGITPLQYRKNFLSSQKSK